MRKRQSDLCKSIPARRESSRMRCCLRSWIQYTTGNTVKLKTTLEVLADG